MPDESPVPLSEFFAAYLDDYFAECDEHLTLVRRHMLTLEAAIGQPSVDKELVNEIFRSFHTVKGLSGMVGLQEAEALAHQMESLLGLLRNGTRLLSDESFQALIAGVQLLEKVIAARRAETPIPDIAPLVARLSACVSGEGVASPEAPELAAAPQAASLHSEPTPNSESSPAQAQSVFDPLSPEQQGKAAAIQSGTKLWRIAFTPAPALAARGVTVEAIRTRLRALGEILYALPKVGAQGGVTFEFLLAGNCSEDAFATWRDDGLLWQSHAESAPAPVGQASSLTVHGASVPRVPTPASTAPAAKPAAPSHVVRVDLARLDELMRLVGELVTSRARLEDQVSRLESDLAPTPWRALQETNLGFERQIRELRDGIMRVRLVPIGEVFERMQFVVRDLARETGKQVHIELTGQRTEIDKLVVERMMDPLLHLVRNSLSHGLESPAERAAAGKPAQGTLALRAATSGDSVVIEIEDDGRGVDAEKVAGRARSLGLIGTGVKLDEAALLDVLCAPGFSTREEADLTSGRGVGMAVVKNTVLELGGVITLVSQPGRGAKFTIQLPLTLMIVEALLVQAGGQTLAVPQPALREVIQIDPATVTTFENNEVLPYRDGVLPLVRVSKIFGWSAAAQSSPCGLVIGHGRSAVGLVVDRVIGQREIVVRALGDSLAQAPGIAGATELSDGRVVLILDPVAFARLARERGAESPVSYSRSTEAALEVCA